MLKKRERKTDRETKAKQNGTRKAANSWRNYKSNKVNVLDCMRVTNTSKIHQHIHEEQKKCRRNSSTALILRPDSAFQVEWIGRVGRVDMAVHNGLMRCTQANAQLSSQADEVCERGWQRTIRMKRIQCRHRNMYIIFSVFIEPELIHAAYI